MTEVREALAAYLQHRSARALAESALERAKALEAMVTATALDLAKARRLVVEGRFALEEALRQDPDGALAKAGLRRLLLVAADLELRFDDVDAASALLAELDPPDVERQARVGERREEIARREANRARLARIGAAADPTLDAKRRTGPTLVLVLAITTVSAVASRGPALTSGTALVVAVAVLVVMVGWIFVVRKRVLKSGFNRRTSALLLIAIVAMVANRVDGYLEARPPAASLRYDLLLFAAVAAASAVTMVPKLWVCTAILVAGSVASAVWPAQASAIFAAATILNLGAAAVVVRRAGQEGRVDDEDDATARRHDDR